MDIERFIIIANRDKDRDQAFSMKICQFLEDRGKTCLIAYSDQERQEIKKALHRGTDCLLVLGGDGTVLEAAHIASGSGTPILGINIGNLGYLAEVDSSNWENALLRVLDGTYEVETRMMIEGNVSGPGGVYQGFGGQALNDIVITRGGDLQVLHYNVYIGGKFLNRFSADGVIVSTATGSTAYSMSAGGPIVEPTARLILLTPISPHTLNNRSIVLAADDQVTIEMIPPRSGGTLNARCFFDGSAGIQLKGGDKINVCRSSGTTRLIRISRQSFLETLHRKMMP